MESEQTIKNWIKDLQAITEGDNGVESRIAYNEWHLLRRVVEDDIVGWYSVTDDVKSTARLIEKELLGYTKDES